MRLGLFTSLRPLVVQPFCIDMRLGLFTPLRLLVVQPFCIDIQSPWRPGTVLNDANEKFIQKI